MFSSGGATTTLMFNSLGPPEAVGFRGLLRLRRMSLSGSSRQILTGMPEFGLQM